MKRSYTARGHSTCGLSGARKSSRRNFSLEAAAQGISFTLMAAILDELMKQKSPILKMGFI